MDLFLSSRALLLQLAAGVASLVILAISPPASGRMILIPIGAPAIAVQTALRNGAGLVGRGPLAGSVVITGDLARLSAPLLGVGAVLLAAPRGCGEVAA